MPGKLIADVWEEDWISIKRPFVVLVININVAWYRWNYYMIGKIQNVIEATGIVGPLWCGSEGQGLSPTALQHSRRRRNDSGQI